MVIHEELLIQHGAVLKSYSESEIIFSEGCCSKYYYQIHEGIVKVSNTFDDGKEFVHGFLLEGIVLANLIYLLKSHMRSVQLLRLNVPLSV